MTEAQIAVEKENLRRYMLRLRDRQSIGEIEQKSQDIIDQVLHLHEFVRARGIACYVSKDSEVNTRPLIRAALNQEKRVLVPVVKKGDIELFFSEIKDLGSELAPGTFGILEPKPENVHPVSESSRTCPHTSVPPVWLSTCNSSARCRGINLMYQ